MKRALLILLILSGFGVQAQTVLKLSGNHDLIVSGTSTLHDWEIVAEDVAGSGSFEITDGVLTNISNLNVKVKVTEIKSGKSGMDNNTFKALKSDEHPYITFSLSGAPVTKSGSNYTVNATGKLSIAGTSKSVTIQTNCVLSGNSITCEGSYKMKMTDFNVEPPTAMFGTIKTGDDITIDFKVKFENSELSKL